MRLGRRPASPPQPAAAEALPRYSVRARADRTDHADVSCTTCHRVFAYGVVVERLRADIGFFLEMHRPFCMAVRA